MSTIKAIFFARFHPEKGSQVLHQIPDGAISTSNDTLHHDQAHLFEFSAIAQHIIPVQEFCNRLITICTNHYRIIGFPVCIEHPRYYRNQFIFNFALVLEDDAEFSGYVTIIRKLAAMFRNLEEQTMFLSREEDDKLWEAVTGGSNVAASMLIHSSNTAVTGDDSLSVDSLDLNAIPKVAQKSPHFVVGGKIYALCEMIFEDLNNYCECMIPIDDSNTINLKIFPTRPPPAPIYAWHVPLSTVQLSTFANTSDLTLTRIVPHIDGISSVAQIAQLADTDLDLTRKAIAHLLYYNCVILLDVFRYGAIYAPTAEFGAFVEDEEAQDEAIHYVSVGKYRRLNTADNATERWGWRSDESALDRTRLIELYSTLRQGLTLRNWCLETEILLQGVDVRRFITFGVIKGFLYRVHKYALLDKSAPLTDKIQSKADVSENTSRVVNWRENRRESEAVTPVADVSLSQYLDGMHCFDEICTSLQTSEKKVIDLMKQTYRHNLVFIHR